MSSSAHITERHFPFDTLTPLLLLTRNPGIQSESREIVRKTLVGPW